MKMMEILEAKRKGALMVLHITTDAGDFTMKIDAKATEEMVWKHIQASYDALVADQLQPIMDAALDAKFKGQTR